MRRFFLDFIPETETFFLPEEESKHIVRVLRMSVGERFLLLNGKGLKLVTEIAEVNPKKCKVICISREVLVRNEQPFHLAIAPTKNTDRMEWMIEKVAEIGATKVSFIQCANSERVQLKIDRLTRVAISAMKQAKHDFLLEINPLVSFEEFVQSNPNGALAHCYELPKKNVQSIKNPSLILIGPEGDFSIKEIEYASKHGYEMIHLGNARLRTETAGLVAATLANHYLH